MGLDYVINLPITPQTCAQVSRKGQRLYQLLLPYLTFTDMKSSAGLCEHLVGEGGLAAGALELASMMSHPGEKHSQVWGEFQPAGFQGPS